MSRFGRVILAVAAVAVVLGGVGWLMQRRLIYFPGGAPPPVETVLPGATTVTIASGDLELDAWFLPADRATVAVFPGNGGNRAGRASLARALGDAGYSVLLVEYRGYGGNPGRPTEAGLMTDARAVRAWLREHADGPVVYFGESLGAAVAVALAVDQPPAALILRSPFTSLPDIARTHYGPVPDWLLVDKYPSIDRIDTVGAPLLVVAGDRDRIVPLEQSRRLYEAARPPKDFVVIEGAGHNDLALLDGPEFIRAVTGFLEQHLSGNP